MWYPKIFSNMFKKKSVNVDSTVDDRVFNAVKFNKELNAKHQAMGIAVNTITKNRTATSFLQDVTDYSDPNLEDRETTVTLSRKLRYIEGVCGSVADLLADFAITRGGFVSDNEELSKVLNDWAQWVNSPPLDNDKAKKGVIYPIPGLRAVARKIFDDYITDGDSVFTLFWEKNVKMAPNSDSGFFLPTSIKVLDTLSLTIDPELAKLGIERIELKLSDDIIKKIKEPITEADKLLKKTIPKEWIKFVNAGDPIILDAGVTYHIKRAGKDWRAWGVGLFTRAFTAISNKRRLQACDAATIDGLINRLTIFKLGLPDKDKNPAYHIPSGARVEALISLVTDPARNNAIVWAGPDLDVIDIGPDGKILEFNEKYQQYDLDVLRALHVSPLLIDGGSSGQAVRDWAAFLSTDVGLEYVRDELARIFTSIGRDIAIANNLEYESLYYEFNTQLLKDEKSLRNMALEVYKLGGTSVETFLKEMGYSFDTELRQKTKEKEEGLDEIFINVSIPGNQPADDEGGRPSNTTNDDLGKESDETTRDIKNEAAKLKTVSDSITSFHVMYTEIFDKMAMEIESQLHMDPSVSKFALINGFSIFRQTVFSQLTNTFLSSSGGNRTRELDFLETWSDKYLDNFYAKLSSKFDEDPSNFGEVLQNSQYRIFLYSQEGNKKAFWLGKIAVARMQGKETGTWICEFDESCKEHHGKEFDLDFLIENFPNRPNCSCIIKF